MTAAIIVIVIAAVVIGVGVSIAKMNRLKGEGKFVNRDMNFQDYDYTFTIKRTSYETVEAEVNQLDLSDVKIEDSFYKYKGQPIIILRSSYGWNAQLDLVGEDAEKSQYRFGFPLYSTNKGTVKHAMEMNVMLTLIEKMFLKLDPDADVRQDLVKRKSSVI